MKAKFNIAEILKDKPEDTELWTDMFGRVTLYVVTDACDAFQVKHHNKEPWFDKDGKFCKEGVLCIYPSKSMRDWHKFAWKKGDVLVSNDGKREVLFKTWVNDSYTKFVGLHCLIINDNEEVEYDNGTTVFNTNDFKGIEAGDAVQTYINTIEERLGGKLNRKNLKIENVQQKFKNGDIVTIMPRIGDKLIYLFKAEDNEKYYGHAFLDGNIAIVNEDSYCQKDFSTARPSTEEEKHQLFEALAKKGKAWDAEKKEVIELKPEVELKPFDKVLVRQRETEEWHANIFSHIYKTDEYLDYVCIHGTWEFCIPYDGNEQLLGTTKDVKG